METKIIDLIKTELKNINPPQKASTLVYRKANALFLNGQSKMLSQSKQLFEFSVDDEFDDYKVKIYINNKIETKCNCKSNKLCPHKLASLMQLHEELTSRKIEPSTNGKKYTRDDDKTRFKRT